MRPLLIVAAVLLGSATLAQEPSAPAAAEPPRSQLVESIEGVADAVRELREAQEREAAHQIDQQALIIQKDMALYTKWIVIASAIGTLISIVGLVALLLSLGQTRKAISIDREIGYAQVRAYLSVMKVLARMDIIGNYISIAVFASNNGQSPAMKVHFICKVSYFVPEGEDGIPLPFLIKYDFIGPAPIGDIRPGDRGEPTRPAFFGGVSIPSNAIIFDDLTGNGFTIGLTIALFATDVFGEEISCVESVLTGLAPDSEVRTISIFSAVENPLISHDLDDLRNRVRSEPAIFPQ